ncbi:hypothetical protein [Cytophaga aurantiaca]|uniref:hypothetical protein n=1 Tax=Cytophaga aurantiaca TaxID=29530 RepID=UPI00037279F9|nr:hypothetical protein [Cytophaga aurantiaca]
MKELLKKYLLTKWWLPMLIFFVASLLYACFFFLPFNKISQLVPVSFILFRILGLLLFFAAVWQFINGKWYWGILQLFTLLSGVAAIIFISYISLVLSVFGPSTDGFASNLKLPENVPLNYPFEERSYVQTSDKIKDAYPASFQLYNSLQPGLYEYDIWLTSKKNGYIYLKAFEITQGIQLSAKRLKERSSIRIYNTEGHLRKFKTSQHFAIYEGDWGNPYAARFEVWFKSDTEEEKEIKVFEKNYVIEGWMR